MLGITSTNELIARARSNARAAIFRDFPLKAPLAGLLALLDDERTHQFNYSWFEQRYIGPRSITRVVNSGGPFAQTGGTTDMTDGGSGITLANNGTMRIEVVNADRFRVRDVIEIQGLTLASGTGTRRAIVDAIDTTSGLMDVTALEAWSGVRNTAANVGINIVVITSAAEEGSSSKQGGMVFPIEPENYTQILRTTVGPFTRTALQMGQKFDKTGTYQEASKQGSIRHMTMMEQAFFFGSRDSRLVTNDSGEIVPRRTLGGIEWFIKQYELGNTGNGGAFDYRPDEASVVAEAYTHETKRDLDFANASVTSDAFDDVLRRMFKSTSDSSEEKICFCDSKFIQRITDWAKRQSLVTRSLSESDTNIGLTLKRIETNHGDLNFRAHPLFEDNPFLTYFGVVCDMGSLKYRYLNGADTDLKKNLQNPDYDGRKDGWLTECGLELQYPERFMILRNLGKIVA